MTLFDDICSYDHLAEAFLRAKRGKRKKPYVKEFAKDFPERIQLLSDELKYGLYRPEHLKTFVITDPKTRVISKSAFRDRVVHHAIHRIIEPLFERVFIHDSYANRKNKGVHKALNRFRVFVRRVSKNNTAPCFVLKCDIRKYFDTVDHALLIAIIARRIQDERLLSLIRIILQNHERNGPGKGMPLGNLTSQFFANVYLNELDQFVKHELKIKEYIRYVDDFVIVGTSTAQLERYRAVIEEFLEQKLTLRLHLQKSRIYELTRGVDFVGYRVFPNHTLLRKRNIKRIIRKAANIQSLLHSGELDFEEAQRKLAGWFGYAKHANTAYLQSGIRDKIAS